MKAVPILMAFMAMVCSNDCEPLVLTFILCLKMGRLKTFWLEMTNSSSLFEKVLRSLNRLTLLIKKDKISSSFVRKTFLI